jgi:holo-[acyl-carrier protein] synthase
MESMVGIDLAEVSRFSPMAKDRNHAFLKKVFSKEEIAYCFSRSNTAQHLAGMFAAKEAASKALGVEKYPFAEIEVRHTKAGAPQAWSRKTGKKLNISVSITHTATIAAAMAVGIQ